MFILQIEIVTSIIRMVLVMRAPELRSRRLDARRHALQSLANWRAFLA